MNLLAGHGNLLVNEWHDDGNLTFPPPVVRMPDMLRWGEASIPAALGDGS